jgi:Arc/MetJ-type ribon-helix-helix transcriptional regulator
MELHSPPAGQEAFIRHGIEADRFHGKEDAVQEAMSPWEERERLRLEILAAVDSAETSLARGEGRRITTHEGVTQLAEDIKRRGFARPARAAASIWPPG